MKKVFDPGEIELADPRGDPNRVIEIQKKVKELLEANNQRQAGILDEIKEEGAWAIPGLLNSLYVWMNQFEDNKPAQKKMGKILAEVAVNNESAIALLFESGVLENPFKTPREIVLQALEILNWKPSSDQIDSISAKIKSQTRSDDIEGLLFSYNILARSGDKKAYTGILKQCTDWSLNNTGDAVVLLGLLVKYFPELAQKTLTEVFKATREMYKNKNLATMLVDAIRPIPSDWWLDSTIVNVSINVLGELTPPRHTAIEYLLRDAAQDARRNPPEFWSENVEKVNSLIQETIENLDDNISETVSRYWFQALSNIAEGFDVIIHAALSDSEPWGTSAALQLFFNRGEQNKHRNHLDNKDAVEEALLRLKDEDSYRYDRAESKYISISSRNKDESDMKTSSKAATLTDR